MAECRALRATLMRAKPQTTAEPVMEIVSITVGYQGGKGLAPMVARILAGLEEDRKAGRLSEVPRDEE